MATTIQISNELLEELKKRKLHEKESYDDVLWDLLEDTMEISEQTKQDIAKARKDIKEGKTVAFEDIKKKINITKI